MQVVIVAGGKGTRLRERLGDLPKPMAPVDGKPLVEHQVELARRHGCDDIVLLLGYGAKYIRNYFGDGSRWNVGIRYFEENKPLGTAGAVLAVLPELAARFTVMYGDTMLNIDLRRFWQAHEDSGVDASLFLHPNDHPKDSDLVELDELSRVRAFHPYPHDPSRYYRNLVNAALYVLNRDALAPWCGCSAFPDFGKHFFPHLLQHGLKLFGYSSAEYIKDAGTPERLDKVNADYAAGRIARGSFETASPAVFVDRDGTLNREVSYIRTPAELEVIEGVPAAIRRLNRAGVRVVVVTNQPVVARGECTEAGLASIHAKLETVLGTEGAYLDAIYYCPHHPHRGYLGERRELKIACRCRKPATGMIDKAVRDLNLDLARCWMVGDSTRDIAMAARAGIRSILLETGHAGADKTYPVQADFTRPDMAAAVDSILQEFPQ